MRPLDDQLKTEAKRIAQIARSYDLDFFDTGFVLVSQDELLELASHHGMPAAYSHWSHAVQYERLKKTHDWAVGKIMELVINHVPAYAYINSTNSELDQKAVIAHVYAHNDFFKNNVWFGPTTESVVDQFAAHAKRIERYEKKYGQKRVEKFLDAVHCIKEHIDIYSMYARKKSHKCAKCAEECGLEKKLQLEKFNNPLLTKSEREKYKSRAKKRFKNKEKCKKIPKKPQKDILLFLRDHAAQLNDWQRDIIDIVREQSYYFAPQTFTKIINEGWATYWEFKIMTEHIAEPSQLVKYSKMHCGVARKNPANPYWLGFLLFLDIEQRWNKGQFGEQWQECTNRVKKERWDTKAMLGIEKIFQVRAEYDDIRFIKEFLTQEFCDEHKFFTWEYDAKNKVYVIVDRDLKEIKKNLVYRIKNYGTPYIQVIDGNYKNRGELYCAHFYDGVPMKLKEVKDTLEHVYKIWQRPVHLETVVEHGNKITVQPKDSPLFDQSGNEVIRNEVKKIRRLFSFNGKKHHEQELGPYYER